MRIVEPNGLVEFKQVQRGDVSIAYESRGNGPSAVLLIMGLGTRAAGWGDALPHALAQHHRVLAIDNRGTGRSSKPRGGYSLEEMARDAVAILDTENIHRAHIVGISMGGMIAQLLALDHAARVDRLVLMSTHCGGAHVVMPSPRVAAALMPSPGSAEEVVRRSFSLLTADGFSRRHPDVIDALVAMALDSPTPAFSFYGQLTAIMASDRHRRLGEIEARTRVVHGDADGLIPLPNGELLARAIPNATLSVLAGLGHLPMWEGPGETSAVVADFLAPNA